MAANSSAPAQSLMQDPALGLIELLIKTLQLQIRDGSGAAAAYSYPSALSQSVQAGVVITLSNLVHEERDNLAIFIRLGTFASFLLILQ